MSSNYAELIRASYGAVARGDLEALVAGWDPEIVIDDPARPNLASPDGLFRGLEEVMGHLRDWQESFAESEQEPVEAFEAGKDTVIVRVRTTARGASSGIVVENERYHAIMLRDGKVAALAIREDRSAAMAVVDAWATD